MKKLSKKMNALILQMHREGKVNLRDVNNTAEALRARGLASWCLEGGRLSPFLWGRGNLALTNTGRVMASSLSNEVTR